VAGLAHAELTEQQREQKEIELKKLRQSISSLRQDIVTTRSKHSSVSKALKKTEVAIGQRVRNLKRLNRQLDQQGKKLKQLYREKRQHEKDMARHRELLGEQLRTAYINGKQEYLKLLLNQQDPAAFSRVMVYYNYFNRARTERIEQALKTIQQLNVVKEKITRQQAVLKKLKQKELAEKRELEKSYQARIKVVAQLRVELKDKDQHLQQLLENEQQISRLLQAIREVMPELLKVPDEAKPFANLKGSLLWPAAGNIKNLFGARRSAGRLTWNGILINAPEGREVHAVARGRVAYAEWLRGYGLLMIIDHGDGYMSLYGHNQSLYRETGDWVEAGEVIASIGNSGGQQHSALYFEIRHNGKPTNPAKWCRKKRRG
jgi:septal ring factor EnvC (AmiA/AmiB activator)